MTLADFTKPGLIVPQLLARDAASAIQELCQALHREKHVTDILAFYHAALNRNFLVGSEMGDIIALPHARLTSLKDLIFAFGRGDEPLHWRSRAARSVRFVFLIAIPATDATQHLLVNSGLARLSEGSGWMEKLNAAEDAYQVLEVFRQVKLRSAKHLESEHDSPQPSFGESRLIQK